MRADISTKKFGQSSSSLSTPRQVLSIAAYVRTDEGGLRVAFYKVSQAVNYVQKGGKGGLVKAHPGGG